MQAGNAWRQPRRSTCKDSCYRGLGFAKPQYSMDGVSNQLAFLFLLTKQELKILCYVWRWIYPVL